MIINVYNLYIYIYMHIDSRYMDILTRIHAQCAHEHVPRVFRRSRCVPAITTSAAGSGTRPS